MSALAINSFYGMDVKKHTSQLQIITNPETRITFKKKTRSFEYWMLHKRDTIFGENRLFEYIDKHQRLTPINEITIPSGDRRFVQLAYISNLEKRYIDTEHKKYVMLGAFLIYDSRILPGNPITALTDYYYSQNIEKSIRSPKLLPQKEIAPPNYAKEKTEPQQRGSVIMQNLFDLIDNHGKPKDLRIVTTQEDLQLLLQPCLPIKPSSNSLPKEESEIPKKKRQSLSRRPSGLIPKLSARKTTIKKPKESPDIT